MQIRSHDQEIKDFWNDGILLSKKLPTFIHIAKILIFIHFSIF